MNPWILWKCSGPYYFKESISNTTNNMPVIPLKKIISIKLEIKILAYPIEAAN
jgi:hypothetical protein